MDEQILTVVRTVKDVQAAIFLDVEYFRIACNEWGADKEGIFSSTRFIQAIQASAPPGFFDTVKRWKCYAYDAMYRGECLQFVPGAEVKERIDLHEMLRKGGFSLRLGQYVVRKQGKPGQSVVQKAVDTQLVVDAMREHAFSKTKLFILITGDTDFLPLITELKRSRKDVVLLHGDMNSINTRLMNAAEVSFDFVKGIREVRKNIQQVK